MAPAGKLRPTAAARAMLDEWATSTRRSSRTSTGCSMSAPASRSTGRRSATPTGFRRCSCMAARAAAATRASDGSSTRPRTAACCSINAAVGVAGRLCRDVDADLSVNTTLHLIGDMERLRCRLGIDRWLLLGLSWGSTLALAYAQRFPDHVAGLVLGPVTAGTRREIDWICREMGRVFPREWARLIALVPEVESHGSICRCVRAVAGRPGPARARRRGRGVADLGGRAHLAGPGLPAEPQRPRAGARAGVRAARHPLLEQRLLPR